MATTAPPEQFPAPSATPAQKRLRDAVHAFLQHPGKELEDEMVNRLRRGSFLAVVTYDPPLPAGHDGRATIPAGTTMHLRGRVAPDGKQLLAIYSDLDAVRKDLPGQPVQTTVLDAERMVGFALHEPHAGAVLNPAGPYLELRRTELRMIVPE
ncbi:MAG: SseB protein N-terminal domain [Solirubrobacterales bacterium]|jgi:hypothetical protein|nr:SseB protein N-terminal domain [Solirubrobacterales bacterium]